MRLWRGASDWGQILNKKNALVEDQLTGATTEAFVQGYSLAQRLAVVGLGRTGLLFRISEYYDFEEAQGNGAKRSTVVDCGNREGGSD